MMQIASSTAVFIALVNQVAVRGIPLSPCVWCRGSDPDSLRKLVLMSSIAALQWAVECRARLDRPESW
jgi:hypothetical protein